jgi:hypothetical protein
MQVFILGAPRSGTTFLASLLSYTKYGPPFETQFITKYFKRLHRYGDLSEKDNFKRLLKDVFRERAVMQWGLDVDPDSFYQELNEDFSYASIVDALCLKRNHSLGFADWGDKTPHYLGDFNIINSMFPKAKYIYIVRDGRDVALSLLQKNWGPNNVFACSDYWNKLNIEKPEFRKLESDGRLMTLKYEDLLDHTERYVSEIYNYLGEDIDSATIKNISSTVQAGNYYKWKTKLSPYQIKIFEMVSANTLRRFGYETSHTEGGLNPVTKVMYILHDKLLYWKFLFEANLIDGFKIKFLGKEPFAD